MNDMIHDLSEKLQDMPERLSGLSARATDIQAKYNDFTSELPELAARMDFEDGINSALKDAEQRLADVNARISEEYTSTATGAASGCAASSAFGTRERARTICRSRRSVSSLPE